MSYIYNKVSFVGSGNVTYNFCNILKNNNISPDYVLIRNHDKKQETEKSLGLKVTLDYDDIIDSDLIVIAVNDESIEEVASHLKDCKGIVVHTSGTQSSSLLDSIENHGVIYPLQTLTKQSVADFSKVPLLITASSSEVLKKIHTFAEIMSDNIIECSDEDRKHIHLSAVFVCNFVNVMLQIGGEILDNKGFNLSVLENLVRVTIDNAFRLGPQNSLTGPARRGDVDTIDKHLKLLEDNAEEKKIYELLTNYIIDKYKKI